MPRPSKPEPKWFRDMMEDLLAQPADELASGVSLLEAIQDASRTGELHRAKKGIWYRIYRDSATEEHTILRLVLLLRVFRGPSALPDAVIKMVKKASAKRGWSAESVGGARDFKKDKLPELVNGLHSNLRRTFRGEPRKRFDAHLLAFLISTPTPMR